MGDWAQLQSVDAGGAFRMLVEARSDAPELADVHRFRHAWEKDASSTSATGAFRAWMHTARTTGSLAAIPDAMSDAAYSVATGHGLRHVVGARRRHGEAVGALNRRARAELILSGVDASASTARR